MDIIYLNDLLDEYPNKTILEINDILINNGIDNKMIKIKVNCRECGCDVITTPGTYRKQKTFACETHKRHKPKGKDSVFYNRIKSICSSCGQELELIPFELQKVNSFGDSNHFCSQQCYWNFRREYYRGEKGAMYNHIYTEEQKDNLARGVAKRFQKTNLTDTKIQLIVNQMLDDLHIEYEREYPIDYYSCDNFLTDYNLIIEVMGDYWHGNPIRYGENGYLMNQIQTRTILKDKQKRGYIKNHYGYPILNLWETDVEKYPDKCMALISEFIVNKGCLENFNSFNYLYENCVLTMNADLILSYQEMNSKDYSHLIKQIS